MVVKESDLKKLAAWLWNTIEPHLANRAVVLAMEGPLGAGKTALVKRLAKAMGIKEVVVSPTFNLHENYGRLDHIDIWRVDGWEEVEALGLSQMLKDRHLIVIEWADRFKPQVTSLKSQAEIVWVKMDYRPDADERLVHWTTSRQMSSSQGSK